MSAQDLKRFAVTPFAFLKVSEKKIFPNAIEFGEPTFDKTPKRFDAIDMGFAHSKGLIFVDAHMLVVTDRNQTIVPSPAIGMDDTGRIDAATDNRQQGGCRAVGYNFSVDAAVTLKDAKHGLAQSAPAAFARTWTPPGASRSEVGFIDFDDADKTLQLSELVGNNAIPEDTKITIDGVSVEAGKDRRFGRVQVQTKAFHHFFCFVFTYLTVFQHLRLYQFVYC